MAMYATITHKKNDSFEYVNIFKSKNAAISGANFDIYRMKCEDSEVYAVRGLDEIGYLRGDFEPENLRKYGTLITRIEKEGE